MLLNEKDYHIVPAKVWYLEMHDNPHFVLPEKPQVEFVLLDKPHDVNTYRYYYKAVGYEWNWLDRLAMTDQDLTSKINADNIDIWVLKINGEDAGYAEFARESNCTEICYFGLFPAFIGKGYGKFFLQWVINKAWSYNPEWVQLNACTLDHPNALGVYQSAGFEIVRTSTEDRKVLNER